MARTLTPERQKLRQEALSLRYDYGLTEECIAQELGISRRVISHWVSNIASGDARIIASSDVGGNNSFVRRGHNSTTFVHLEGDCLEKLKDIPDNSVDCLIAFTLYTRYRP